jgi:hypothetical protein
LSPDADGVVKFRIQEYLWPELEGKFTYPEDNDEPVQEHTDFAKSYWIEYAETWENTAQGLTPSNEYYAMPARITKRHEVALAELGLSLLDELSSTGMFLSWHPGNKFIGKSHPEKLYFLMLDTSASGGIYARITYTNGTKTVKTLWLGTLQQFSVYEICCGHDALQLQYAAYEVEKIEVYVYAATMISEMRTLYIDQNHQENERVFLFLNSLGVYETLRTTGVHEKENLFNHDIVDLAREDEDISWSAESSNITLMEETFNGNTGWISKEEVDWVNDFLASSKRYLFEDHNLVEIMVTSQRVFQHRDDETLYFVAFEYKKSLTSGFSRITVEPLLTERGEPIITEDEEIVLI